MAEVTDKEFFPDYKEEERDAREGEGCDDHGAAPRVFCPAAFLQGEDEKEGKG